MKILVDMDKCQHYGQCVFEADDIFSLGEDGKLSYRSEVDENRRSAVESWPGAAAGYHQGRRGALDADCESERREDRLSSPITEVYGQEPLPERLLVRWCKAEPLRCQ